MQSSLLYWARFLICLYTGMMPPLLPVFMDKLGLSVVMAGFLISAFSMCTSFSQPVFGWIGDRVGYAYFVCLSPLATGIAIGSVGLCSSFAGMVAALSIAGLSIAAFHPAAFAYTASYPLCARPKALSHLLLWLVRIRWRASCSIRIYRLCRAGCDLAFCCAGGTYDRSTVTENVFVVFGTW